MLHFLINSYLESIEKQQNDYMNGCSFIEVPDASGVPREIIKDNFEADSFLTQTEY